MRNQESHETIEKRVKLVLYPKFRFRNLRYMSFSK